jgi:hypothetical protein
MADEFDSDPDRGPYLPNHRIRGPYGWWCGRRGVVRPLPIPCWRFIVQLRLYVGSVLALAILLVPWLWAQGIETDSVLRACEAALAAGDLNAILSLFAEDAVVATSSGRLLIGKQQIRGWVEDQVGRHQREEAGFRHVQGNKLSWAGKVYRDDWHKLEVSPLNVTHDALIEGARSSSLIPLSPQNQRHGCRRPARRTK